jgi:hypothetical protein
VKQVKLWIAVCPFGDALYLHYMYNKHSDEKFYNQVIKIIQRKCERFRPKHNYFDMSCVGILKDGETYESVLDALWEFQLSLIPDYKPDKEFMPRHTAPRISDRYGGDKISDYFVPKDFYDPSTGIITITKFD